MKLFLIKLSKFLLIPLLYFTVNMLVNWWMYKDQDIPLEKVSMLIVGDSHPQRSLDPELLHEAENISQLAEPYLITYWKLKAVYESFVPDTLVLGFAPHNISAVNDLKLAKNRWSAEMFKRSYSIVDFRYLHEEIQVDYKKYVQTLWKQTALFPKRNHVHFIGEYANKAQTKLGNWKKVIDRHYFFKQDLMPVSNASIAYLDSIARLCEAKQTQLILVSNPLHETYLTKIPKHILVAYDSLKTVYDKKAIIYDLSKTYYPDSLYLNCDHLNSIGAKRFTTSFKSFLKGS